MKKIISFIKNEYKFIILMILIFIVMTMKLPFYIDAPGGITNMNEKVLVEGGNSSDGSFNLTYVKEYKATPVTYLLSFIIKDWELISYSDVMSDNMTSSDYEIRDKLLLLESISNATYIAYTKAGIDVEILSEYIYVASVLEDVDSDLEIGDEIVSINEKSVSNKNEIDEIVSKLSVGDIVKLSVIRDEKKLEVNSKLIEIDGVTKLGIYPVQIKDLKTNPDLEIIYSKTESGPSSGLMLTLEIYNQLVDYDITNGLKIAGTGTMEMDGSIGSVGGIKDKLKSASNSGCDIFLIPSGENEEEALEIIEKYDYDITLVSVSDIDEVIDYLYNFDLQKS